MVIGVGAAQFIFYYDIVAVKEGVSRKETHYRADLLMSEVLNIFPDAWVRLINEKLCLAAVCAGLPFGFPLLVGEVSDVIFHFCSWGCNIVAYNSTRFRTFLCGYVCLFIAVYADVCFDPLEANWRQCSEVV